MRHGNGDGSASFKVVLDTNIYASIYASAFRNPEGVPARIFRAGGEGRYRLIVSPEIIHEYAGTSREKFGTREEKILKDIKLITHETETIIQPHTLPNAIPDDSDDNHILACALEGKADFIVSGDKHLLRLKEYEGIVIVRPMDFLRTLGLEE